MSVLAHGVLLGGALYLSTPKPPPAPEPRVHWPGPNPGPRGGGGNPGTPPSKPTKNGRHGPPRTVRTPVEVQRPVDLPARDATEGQNEVPGRNDTGPGDGKGPGGPGGGGPECATPPCGGGGEIFSEDVVAAVPVLVAGPEVRLSQEAVRSGVAGTMIVRCVITAAGTVEACEVLKGLPLAEAAVLAALQGRQYRPAQIQGRAVSVRHMFTVKINPPR